MASRFLEQLSTALKGGYSPSEYIVHFLKKQHEVEVDYNGIVIFKEGLLVMRILVHGAHYEMRGCSLTLREGGMVTRIEFENERECKEVYFMLQLLETLHFTNELFAKEGVADSFNAVYEEKESSSPEYEGMKESVDASTDSKYLQSSERMQLSLSLTSRLNELRGPEYATSFYTSGAAASSEIRRNPEDHPEPLADFNFTSVNDNKVLRITPETLEYAIISLNAIIPVRAFESGKRYKFVFRFVDGLVLFSVYHGLTTKYSNEVLEDVRIVRQEDRKRVLVSFLPISTDMEVEIVYFQQFYHSFAVFKQSGENGIEIKEKNEINLL